MKTNIIYLKSIEKHKFKKELEEGIAVALDYFPELKDEIIYVGILSENRDGLAHASCENNLMLFKRNIKPTMIIIFHELSHIVVYLMNQNNEYQLPETSEQFCSIFAIAHMPSWAIDENRIPYILENIQENKLDLLPQLCRDALKYREEHRNYIHYFVEKCKTKINAFNNQKKGVGRLFDFYLVKSHTKKTTVYLEALK